MILRVRDIDGAWLTAGGLALLALLGTGLTAAAASWPGMPGGLAPFWPAIGLAIGPFVRWGALRSAPPVAGAMLVGAWLGEALDARSSAIAVLTVVQCAAVGWGLRRSLPGLMADRRPVYRVRLAHLARFLLGITLPACLLAGAAVAAFDVLAGRDPAAALAQGLLHAAASALSIALLAPLMWWDQLRAVSWPVALAFALASTMLPWLAAADARLLWMAPVIVILAGYAGSTWVAVLSVACMGASLLLQSRAEALPAFDGPEGFIVWLLVVWRLLGAGLLASIWSERRSGVHRREADGGRVQPTAAAAWRQWRMAATAPGEWLTMLVDDLAPADTEGPACEVAAGGSLPVRRALGRLALRVRHTDTVVGVGRGGALLLLRLDEGRRPDVTALRARCRAAVHPGIAFGEARTLPTLATAFLVASAAYLDQEQLELPDAATPWPEPPGSGHETAAPRGLGGEPTPG